jgi:hypothetical protein
MFDLLSHLSAYYHLWMVAAVIGLIAWNYGSRFVAPALRLKSQLGLVNDHLAKLAAAPSGNTIDLAELKNKLMTTQALQHAWGQYAATLQPQWQSVDAGPLGVARQRASQLSRAFFAHMHETSLSDRIDLSQSEQLTRQDQHLSELWFEYQQALETLQQLEMSGQTAAGRWQAASAAEQHFTEQALVDSPLRTHFYKNIPGILTGVGIIGTFTGLIAALVGFDVSDPTRVQAELSQLVQTVGHAFLVSALAITLAMVFTWVEKSMLTSRYRQVEELQQNLDNLFQPQEGAQQLARLTLATEMQATLTYQLLSHWRGDSSGQRSVR